VQKHTRVCRGSVPGYSLLCIPRSGGLLAHSRACGEKEAYWFARFRFKGVSRIGRRSRTKGLPEGTLLLVGSSAREVSYSHGRRAKGHHAEAGEGALKGLPQGSLYSYGLSARGRLSALTGVGSESVRARTELHSLVQGKQIRKFSEGPVSLGGPRRPSFFISRGLTDARAAN
jgi:hypothetical protein